MTGGPGSEVVRGGTARAPALDCHRVSWSDDTQSGLLAAGRATIETAEEAGVAGGTDDAGDALEPAAGIKRCPCSSRCLSNVSARVNVSPHTAHRFLRAMSVRRRAMCSTGTPRTARSASSAVHSWG